MSKKLFVKTYGCQMNMYDSSRMTDALKTIGYQTTDTHQDADIVVVNTCHIREKATEKLFSELGRIEKGARKTGQVEENKKIVAVTGCVAQAEGDEITKRSPFVDIVLGPQAYHRLPQMVMEIERRKKEGDLGKRLLDTDFPTESKFDILPEASEKQGVSSFLTIQEGCDQFCKFCCVPYTRGAEVSRPAKAIMEEAIRLVSLGAREIVLLGQNVNGYHGQGLDGEPWRLGHLVRALAKIEKLKRIRYTTSHPTDMTDDLIEAHRDEPKLMPFLHLPVQSGSTRVLEEMNRKHSREYYIDVIEKIRKARPDMAFSSDFIVGYPSETDEEFEETMTLVEEIDYAQAYSFKYSPRPGTPAALSDEQIPEDIKTKRLDRLQEVLKKQQGDYNAKSLHQTYSVLVERLSKDEGRVLGRTPHLQWVSFEGDESLIGNEVQVFIEETGFFGLRGRLIS